MSLCSWRKAFLASVGKWDHHAKVACLKASLLLQMNDSPGCVLTPGTKKELLPKEKEKCMPRSLSWQRLWCSTELWPSMKVCDKWVTMNTASRGDGETHQREKDLFQPAFSACVVDTHARIL